MFKKANKFISILVVLTLTVLLMAQSTYANSIYGMDVGSVYSIEPRWTNVSSSNLTVGFSTPNVHLAVSLIGLTGTTYSAGVVKCEAINASGTSLVGYWNNLSSTSNIFTFSNSSISKIKGTKYRLTVTIIAKRNGALETINVSKEATYNG